MGVYRNNAFTLKSYQRLNTVRIFIETVIFSVLFIYNMYKALGKTQGRFIYVFEFYHFVMLLNGPVIMISGILNSRSFKLFIDNFESVHHYFQDEPTYIKCSKRLNIAFVVITTVALITSIGFEASKMIGRLNKSKEPWLFITLFLADMIVENRYILEHTVMYIYITTVRNLLKCLNNCIFDIEAKYSYHDIKSRVCSVNRQSNEVLTVEQVEQWATQFKCLLICSRNLSVSFKAQVNIFYI